MKHKVLLYSKEMPVPNSPDQVDSSFDKIIEKEIQPQTYFKIVPVTLTNNRIDIEVHTNALSDTGSDTILIHKDIVGKLTGIRRALDISNSVTDGGEISSRVVNFIVTPQNNKLDCFDIDDARVMSKLNIPNNKIDEVVMNKYEHLHDISLPKLNRSDVKVLIGSEYPELLPHQELKKENQETEELLRQNWVGC